MSLRFVQIVARVRIFFLFKAEWYSTVYTHILSIHLLIFGLFPSFNAAMNLSVEVPVRFSVFSSLLGSVDVVSNKIWPLSSKSTDGETRRPFYAWKILQEVSWG